MHYALIIQKMHQYIECNMAALIILGLIDQRHLITSEGHGLFAKS